MSWAVFWTLAEIQVVCVILIDLSGGMESIKGALGRWLKIPAQKISLKPLDCSLCSTHWAGLIWLICSGNITLLAYMVLLLLAIGTTITNRLILAIFDLINGLLDWR